VIATLSPEGPASMIKDFHQAGFQIESLGLSRIGSIVSGSRKLRDLAKKVRAGIVHCHGLRSDILAAYATLPCARVSTIHADLERDYCYTYGALQGTIAAKGEYMALRRFDAVVAVSELIARRAGAFALKPEVIPNGIDLKTYFLRPEDNENSDIRRKLGWPLDRFVVLHTGVLIERKQPLAVIGAFLQSELSQNEWLVFAGSGPLLEACKAAARGVSNIRFLGHRSDLPDLLRAADAVISSATSEGLPLALLEACACGLRIVASDIEAHRYIASLFPEQVDLFPLGDPSALRERLNVLGQSGRRRPIRPPAASLQAISAERMSLLYQAVYEGVLSRS